MENYKKEAGKSGKLGQQQLYSRTFARQPNPILAFPQKLLNERVLEMR